MEEKELNIDIDDVGTILKSSRLKSKKSLEEISSELCIRKIYLTALEESDYETLPPIPYGVGYVRTYARYLGLSPERAVMLYKAAAMQDEPTKAEEVVTEPEVNKINKWHIASGLMALVIVCGIWNLVSSKQTEKTQKSLPEIVAKEEVLAEKTKLDEETTEENSGLIKKEINKQVAISETKNDKVKEKSDEKENEKAVKENTIVLSFSGECWVKVLDKKKVYIERVYHKGDVKEIPYSKNMFISVGVPENVKISVNGKEKNLRATKRKMNIPVDSLN